MRSVLLLAAALLCLAGCGRKEEAKAPSSEPTQPFTFVQKSADGEVTLSIDQRVGAFPALHQRLFSEGRRELTDFLARAGVDRPAALEDGAEAAPYSREVKWQVTAETSRLLSLKQAWADYTGGAHGNYGSDTLIWSKGGEVPVLQSALFRPDADYALLDQLLCNAVKVAKEEKLGPETAGAADWTCPTWKDSRATLAPSTEKGLAGGVIFTFDPYVLGAYVEGEYEAVIPQKAFRTALAPAYLGEFGGEPRLDAADSPASAPDEG
jgi:predicted small lipoprotein YifL